MLFAIVIAEETPDLVSMIDRKTGIGFSAETIGSEIFGHNLTSIWKTAIKTKKLSSLYQPFALGLGNKPSAR